MKRIAIFSAWLLGCQAPAAPGHGEPASKVTAARPEGSLPQVHLTPSAVGRLGIETAKVTTAQRPARRLVGGEVAVAPGGVLTVVAPVAGQVQFTAEARLVPGQNVQLDAPLLRLTAVAPTDRDTRAKARREVDAARANLAALNQRVRRNEALLAERSGSARAVEEAVAVRDVARADLVSAQARLKALTHDPLLADVALTVTAPATATLRAVNVADGQTVPGGTVLLELVVLDPLVVRVPVSGADLARLNATAAAQVRRVGTAEGIEASPTVGPPTAELDRGTVDRFYKLPSESGLAPGERVLVSLALRDPAHTLSVPASAVVFDAWGGAWVYGCAADAPGIYTRARVDLLRRDADAFLIAHGPPEGACVVSVGAAEIFGAEFPPGH